jgi:hypothetical protein
MYDFLQTLAADNDWFFEYSRTDYQNLYDGMEYNKVHLFVDPITIDSKFSDSGFEIKTFSGKLMILLSSNVDESYTDKYNTYIKPIMEQSVEAFKSSLNCSDFIINKFQSTEIINLFDVNLDGLIINYNITLPL